MDDELFVWWRMIEEELSDLIGAEIWFESDSEAAAWFIEDAAEIGAGDAYEINRDLLIDSFKQLGSLTAIQRAFPRMVVEEIYAD